MSFIDDGTKTVYSRASNPALNDYNRNRPGLAYSINTIAPAKSAIHPMKGMTIRDPITKEYLPEIQKQIDEQRQLDKLEYQEVLKLRNKKRCEIL